MRIVRVSSFALAPGARAATRAWIAALVAVPTIGVGVAYGQGDNGGIGSGGSADHGVSEGGGGNGDDGGGDGDVSDSTPDPGGRVELKLANARPRKAYALGSPAVFRYEIAGNEERDLEVEVVSKADREVVASFEEHNVIPKQQHEVAWAGRTSSGTLAHEGEYRFRVVSAAGQAAEDRHADGNAKAGFYKHKFPVRGRHTYGDGIGAGRGHTGQDVMADCGTRLVAAHGGTVSAVGYDGGGGGNYLVINGKHDRFSYVYMHLRERPDVHEGEKVKTGQRVGIVGDTGNATACHLHFELWSKPGWYAGGHWLGSVTKNLKRWDRWS